MEADSVYTGKFNYVLPYSHNVGDKVYKLSVLENGRHYGTAFCIEPRVAIKDGYAYTKNRTLLDEEKKNILSNIVYLCWLTSDRSDWYYAKTQVAIWNYLEPGSSSPNFSNEEIDRLIRAAKDLSMGPNFSQFLKDGKIDFTDKTEIIMQDARHVLNYFEIATCPEGISATIDGNTLKLKKTGELKKGTKLGLIRKAPRQEPFMFLADKSQNLMVSEMAIPTSLIFELKDETPKTHDINIQKYNISNIYDRDIDMSSLKYRLILADIHKGRENVVYQSNIYRKGESLGDFTADSKGFLTIKGLEEGEYDLVEISAPLGFCLNQTAIRISVTDDGQVQSIQRSANLSSAIDELKKLESSYKEGLRLAGIEIHGELPSTSLIRESDDQFNNNETIRFYDRQEYAYFIIEKKLDKLIGEEANSTDLHSDLSLVEDGAEFAVLDETGKQIDHLITNKKGLAASRLLPLGKYILRQTKSRDAYKLSEDQEIILNNERSVYRYKLVNPAKEMSLRIVKLDSETKERIAIPGVAFELYRQAEGGEAITFKTASGEQKTIFVTDDDGVAYFPNRLNYGDYYLQEIKSPRGYFLEPGKRQKLSFNNDSLLLEGEVLETEVYNEAQKGRIELHKTADILDSASVENLSLEEILEKKNMLDVLARLRQISLPKMDGYDDIPEIDDEEDVDVESEISGEEFSDKEGENTGSDELLESVIESEEDIVEENLETTGNLNNGNENESKSESESGSNEDKVDKEEQSTTLNGSEAFLTDNPLHKKYNYVSTSYKKDYLADCEFIIRAAEDIYSASSRKEGGEYKPVLIYQAGTEIERFRTNEKEYRSEPLPIGKYVLEEISARAPFIKAEPLTFEISEKNQLIKIYDQALRVHNNRQKIAINFKKTFLKDPRLADISSDELREKTIFALFNKEDIVENGVIVKKDSLLDIAIPNENLIVNFETAFATDYYIRELTTHEAYELSPDQIISLDFDEEPRQLVRYETIPDVENKPVNAKIRINKVSKDDKRQLEGVKFSLYLEDKGEKIKQGDYLTDKDGYIEINNLRYGKYYLEESEALKGYMPMKGGVEIFVERGRELFDYNFENEESEIFIHKKDFAGQELPGAKLSVWDENGVLVDSWTSGQEPHRIARLELGKKYILKEDEAPAGYATASEIEFTFDELMHRSKIDMLDEEIKVKIKKIDSETGENVLGAILAVYDSKGEEILRFSSSNEDFVIKGLKSGEIYCLRELESPVNYHKAEDIYFEVKDTGEVQVIQMEDVPTRVIVEKVDHDNSYPVIGAKLAIFNMQGEKIIEFISNGAAKEIYGLNLNEEYILREVEAPSGYIRGKDINFKISENDRDVHLIMENSLSKLKIKKLDEAGNLLKGAKLQLLDQDMNEVALWTSSDEEQVIRGLNIGEQYTLRELEAPSNYALAEDLVFYIEDDGEKVIELINKKLPLLAKTGESNSHKHIDISLGLLFISLSIFCLNLKRKGCYSGTFI